MQSSAMTRMHLKTWIEHPVNLFGIITVAVSQFLILDRPYLAHII